MIIAAAIKIGDLICHLPAPARHHHVLRAFSRYFDKRTDEGYRRECQGFLTDNGQFMDRAEAFRHALECGQGTPRRTAMMDAGSVVYDGGELFSEDLW